MVDQQENGGASMFSKIKWVLYGLIAIWVLSTLYNRSNNSNSGAVTIEKKAVEEGLITTLREVETDVFKIENEEVVAKKEDSRLITNYMDGTIDTFTLQEVALIDTTVTDRSNPRYRNRMMHSVVMGGAMGYLMGRSMSSPLMRSSYSSQSAYNKSSTQTRTRMTNSAARRSVSKKPSKSGRSGFGSGKSTRSYGG